MKKILLLSATILLFANALASQNNKNDEILSVVNKKANIEKIIKLTLNKDHMIKTIKTITDNINNSFNIKINSEIEKAISSFTDSFVTDLFAEDTLSEISNIYDKNFTDKEISELLNFYQSEIGKKTIEKTPEIMSQMASVSTKLMQKHMNKYIAEMQELSAKSKK